jgi:hypothetical protein
VEWHHSVLACSSNDRGDEDEITLQPRVLCFERAWEAVIGNLTTEQALLESQASQTTTIRGMNVLRHHPSQGPAITATATLIQRSALGKLADAYRRHAGVSSGCEAKYGLISGGSDSVCMHDDVLLSTLSDQLSFYIVQQSNSQCDSALVRHEGGRSTYSIREQSNTLTFQEGRRSIRKQESGESHRSRKYLPVDLISNWCMGD